MHKYYFLCLSIIFTLISNSAFSTWQAMPTIVPQPTNTPVHLLSTQFYNLTTGWVVGRYGKIYSTTSGAVSWTERTNPSLASQDLYSVFFLNNFLGWAAGDSGTILYTSDGGANWTKATISAGSPQDYFFHGVCFLNSSLGYAVGTWSPQASTPQGTLFKSTNGGATWTLQTSSFSSPPTKSLLAIQFVDALNGWLVGEDAQIYRTTNGGQNWMLETIPFSINNNAKFYALYFLNAQEGWAAGFSVGAPAPLLHYSTNAWADMSSNLNFQGVVSSIFFTSTSNGWIAGSNRIFSTQNGGLTWTQEWPIGTTQGQTLYSLYFLSSPSIVGFAAGEAGCVLQYPATPSLTPTFSPTWDPSQPTYTLTATQTSTETLTPSPTSPFTQTNTLTETTTATVTPSRTPLRVKPNFCYFPLILDAGSKKIDFWVADPTADDPCNISAPKPLPIDISLWIYSLAGEPIFKAGGKTGTVCWYGVNKDNQPVASGVYLFRVKAGGSKLTGKIVVVR